MTVQELIEGAMSGTITIPAPIAEIDDIVEVANYRVKSSDPWEHGTVQQVRYSPPYSLRRYDGTRSYVIEGKWTYRVWIQRPIRTDRFGRQRGGGYSIEVSGDKVRRLPESEQRHYPAEVIP